MGRSAVTRFDDAEHLAPLEHPDLPVPLRVGHHGADRKVLGPQALQPHLGLGLQQPTDSHHPAVRVNNNGRQGLPQDS